MYESFCKEVYIMANIQTEILALAKLRAACGLTVTDIQSITGVSRVTLYKLERGKGVRFNTVCSILHRMYESPKCERASLLISKELRRIGAERHDRGVDREMVDRIDDAQVALEGIVVTGEPISNLELIKAVRHLRDTAEEVLRLSR